MSQILDLFQYPFMQRALLVGLLLSIVCSILSVFVVLRRMAFVGHGISHAAFGGIAFALLVGWTPAWGAAISCLLAGFFIAWFGHSKRISEDSAIGLALTITMALGSIFIALRQSYTPDIYGYLFGNILLIGQEDLFLIITICFLNIVLLAFFFQAFYSISFHEELAWVDGLPIHKLRFLLISMLALLIVVSVKLIGVVLISAFLLIPGLTACQLSSRINWIFLLACCIGSSSVFFGLIISAIYDLPSGAVIVVLQFICFILALIFQKISASRGLP